MISTKRFDEHTYSLCPRHPRSPATAGTSRRFLALSLAAGSGLWHLSGPTGDFANNPGFCRILGETKKRRPRPSLGAAVEGRQATTKRLQHFEKAAEGGYHARAEDSSPKARQYLTLQRPPGAEHGSSHAGVLGDVTSGAAVLSFGV